MLILALALTLVQEGIDPYYKFPEGTVWTYGLTDPQNKLRDAKTTMTVTSSEVGKVTTEVIVQRKKPETKLYVWFVDKGILYWGEKQGDDVSSQSVAIYKQGSKKGDTWAPPFNLEHKATHLGTEEVQVPAGVYKHAIHVRVVLRDGASMIQYDAYLVEKVGLVKLTQKMDGNQATMELVQMKLATK